MPSGVSHGSTSPAGSGPVAFSKAIFAKSGMRLIVSHHSTCGTRRSLALIVVWMLVADDAPDLVGTVVLERRPARQVRDRDRPAKPGFAAELLRRHQLVGAVESAGHNLD